MQSFNVSLNVVSFVENVCTHYAVRSVCWVHIKAVGSGEATMQNGSRQFSSGYTNP